MDGVRFRTLRPEERGALLDLLDLWPLSDGWRGRDFFGRYLEADPTYADENVWVAERDGRLVACVQIFPRRLRLGATAPPGARVEVPTGGIGTVFTHPDARGGGVASALLERARTAMRDRGLELSLLFASRHAFYARLGWALFARERLLFLRDPAAAPIEVARAGAPFEPARDLADAMALHAAYSAPLDGTVVRDPALWRGGLRFAGNPREDFQVARDRAGRLVAYARGVVLEGVYLLSEWARRDEPEAAQRLADLVVGLMQPRDPDPLARAGRSSAELRRVQVAPPVPDAALLDALRARGVALRAFEGRDAMLCCLAPDALARRIGDAVRPGEEAEAFLRRVLPPERVAFWAADRF